MRTTLTEKLAEIARRSPNHLAAIETIVDFTLQILDVEGVADPAAYELKCDQPTPKKAND